MACVSFERFCLCQFAPSPPPEPSFGLKLFCDAQASIKVPSTEKCSSDNKGFTWPWFKSFIMNFWNTSPCCRRSRFLLKVVASQTGSSGESPVERLIGSIRRECLDHVVICGEWHLRHMLLILQWRENTPFPEQGRTNRANLLDTNSRRITPSVCSDLISDMDKIRYEQVPLEQFAELRAAGMWLH
jgi:hypothetical protein